MGGRTGDIIVPIVLGAIFIAFAIALFASTMVRQESKLTSTFIDGVIALNLAEAGVDQAFYYLKKANAGSKALRDALETGTRCELSFTEPFFEELRMLAPPEGRGNVKVKAIYEPSGPSVTRDLDPSKVRLGLLTVQAQGTYTNPQKGTVAKQVKVRTKVLGANILVVAPDHGFFCRDPRLQYYHVPSLTLDARGTRTVTYAVAVYE
jgi:hypothetical protein